MSESVRFCPHCGVGLTVAGRFCSQCGGALQGGVPVLGGTRTRTLTVRSAVILGITTLAVWGGAWSLQQALSGEPPPGAMASFGAASTGQLPTERGNVEPASGHPATAASDSDPTLIKLREAVKATPTDLAAQRALATELLSRVRSAETPPTDLTMELIQTLAEILKQDSNDKDAIITMADLSFNQQVFDKAVAYYERFLKLEPNDNQVRARLGSALAFVGKFPRAQEELRKVLKAEPDNFEAAAYLAITFAQQGNTAEAVKLGEEALKKAPSDEARARFTAFLDSVKSKPATAETTAGSTGASSDAGQTAAVPASGASGAVSKVVQQVQENSVAGPKFARHDLTDDGKTLRLYFKQFPMEAMPPFIKDRFLNKIKDAAVGGELTAVAILDADTGTEMARVAP